MRKVEEVRNPASELTGYRVRFRHGTSPRTGKPLQTSEAFPPTTQGKRQAEKFAKMLDALGPAGALEQLYDGDQDDAPLLDQVAADTIKYMTGVTPGYKLTSERLWTRSWGVYIGHTPANMVSRDDIADALNQLATRYSPKSLKNQRGLLHSVLERCIDKGYLTTNPARKLRLPQGLVDPEDDDTEMVCLTQAEWEVLYAHMAPHYRPITRFLIGTGCRWGEAVALRVSELDLDSGQPVVRIRRALKWSPDGKRTIGPPKTKKSKRTIWLPPEVVEDLRPLVEGMPGKALVFTAPRGGIVAHRTYWSDHWRPAVWRAQHCAEHTDPGCRCGTAHPKRCKVHDEIPEPCGCAGTLRQAPRVHDLRHTHASWLLAKGVPIHVVQARLGHESIKTTVDTYSHLMPDAQMMAARAASLTFTEQPLALN